jgi:hypothetical protein
MDGRDIEIEMENESNKLQYENCHHFVYDKQMIKKKIPGYG